MKCDKCQAEAKPGGVILHKPSCSITESQLYIDTGDRYDPRCTWLHEATVVHVRGCSCRISVKQERGA